MPRPVASRWHTVASGRAPSHAPQHPERRTELASRRGACSAARSPSPGCCDLLWGSAQPFFVLQAGGLPTFQQTCLSPPSGASPARPTGTRRLLRPLQGGERTQRVGFLESEGACGAPTRTEALVGKPRLLCGEVLASSLSPGGAGSAGEGARLPGVAVLLPTVCSRNTAGLRCGHPQASAMTATGEDVL